MQSQINPSSGGSPQWSGGLGRLQTLSSQFESHAYYNNNKFYFFYLKIKKTCAFMIIVQQKFQETLLRQQNTLLLATKGNQPIKYSQKLTSVERIPCA